MAKKITEILIDDLDGTEIGPDEGETVRFALDGVRYEIDLTNEHAAELRDALRAYVQKGRRSTGGGRGARASKPNASRSGSDLSAIREWLRAQGHEVSDRGRIPARLVAEYEAANG
ncbi:Lsr2 family protein [Leucobacter sp. CSA1]|uniref:Lsr2 family protein n=1 Tax=Leucobacter chromiisoli TaxID=2796471 RepID=A0A934UU98_9MICO|nr:Lsr2 family protein [Leucobacter chromiisoli]MBK0419254.1 Lsr2 family protein [Leucobacter chromiisoli]